MRDVLGRDETWQRNFARSNCSCNAIDVKKEMTEQVTNLHRYFQIFLEKKKSDKVKDKYQFEFK